MGMRAESGQFSDARIERSRRVIREAALAELSQAGYGAFAIESVAARAGVGKSTIYRHWNGKLDLIADALETLNEQPAPETGAGTPRQRVERLMRHLAEVLADSIFSSCVPALIEASEHDDAVRDFYHRYCMLRRQALVDAIADGVACGDFTAGPDPDLAALALVGPLFYRRTMTAQPYDPANVGELIDQILGRKESNAG